MDDLLASFFNLEKPCPEKIPNCQSLRDNYQLDLKQFVVEGVCSPCVTNSIRQKYITFILALTNS